MEQKLIEIAKKYVETETGLESELLSDQLFDLAAQVSHPKTEAGRAIVAWTKAEYETDFSMSANDEFEAMCRAVSAA